MAYIKNIRIRKTISNAIKYVCDIKDINDAKDYITNKSKTLNGDLVDCNFGDWMNADNLWEATRKKYGKNDKVLAHHFVQSFDPIHSVTPEEAHKIGMELAEKQFGALGFDYIVATHIDKNHIHNHILVNNVARTGINAGKKYYHNNKTYRYLRQLNIDTCRNNGIPAIDCKKTDEAYRNLHEIDIDDEKDNPQINVGKNYKSISYIKTPAYDSWKNEQINNKLKIKIDINDTINDSYSWDEFIKKMEMKGYKIKWKTQNGEDRKFVTYIPFGSDKGTRDRSLGDFFKKEEIIKRIEKNIMKQKNNNNLKTNNFTYKDISWKFKKDFFDLLNPKYIIIKYKVKKYYKRKSLYEQKISEKYYIELYKRSGLTKANDSDKNRISILNNNILHNNELTAIIKKYSTNNTHINFQDILNNISNQIKHNNLLIINSRKKLLTVEQKIKLYENYDNYFKIYETYMSLTEKEKNIYYKKYKFEIQNFKYSERELSNKNYNINEIRDEKEKIIIELNKKDNTSKQLNKDFQSIKKYENNLYKNSVNSKENETSR